MSLPKIGKKAHEINDGSTTERNSDFSAPTKRTKPPIKFEAKYNHNLDMYMNDLSEGKVQNASPKHEEPYIPSRSTNKLLHHTH